MTEAARARPISLSTRFAWATGLRLGLLTVVLAVVVFVSVNDPGALSYSVQLVITVLVCAFALSALYAWFSRIPRSLRILVPVQLVVDQLIWTVVAYLSGGLSSGATSFYGVTCFIGALLSGFRGALTAAIAAVVCYGVLAIGLFGGLIVVPPDQPASLYTREASEMVAHGVATLLMLTTVVLLAGTLAERLRSTGGELLRAEARAEQAEREASLGRLAAGLAHEIRNPLGAISGSVALLGAASGLTDEQKQLYDIIQRESDRLNDLLSDMLDLANPRTPNKTQVVVGTLVQDVVQLARHSGRGGTDVHVEATGSSDGLVAADDAMLRQMLWNLVRNAVQASKPGGTVSVVVEVDDDGVSVEVVDRGPGLKTVDREKIFDPFYTTRAKGTGIGLAVVRRIADQHGYLLSVTDTPGGGATFRVDLGPEVPDSAPEGGSQGRGWTLFPGPK